MATRSRTYKLRLSTDGISLFFDCHARVGRQACGFISYGSTLFTALNLLATRENGEIGDMLESAETGILAGDITCFVGYPPELADLVDRIMVRIRASEEIGEPITVARLYLAALRFLGESEDREILAAFR